jgi:hypothetical protein
MKRRSILLATLTLAGLFPLAAVAEDKPAAPAAAAQTATKAKKVEIVCETTSSRIRRTKIEDCGKAAQPTTNYYKHDLERTGQTDMGNTLKELDPRFR